MVTTKAATNIQRWIDWPSDVREGLRHYNHIRRLSFRGEEPFRCTACSEMCEGQRYGNAIFDEQPWCDDCLIRLIRGWSGEIS